MLEKLKHNKWLSVRDVSRFVGQIISMSIVIGQVAQIMTKSLSIYVLKARRWNSYIKLSEESLQELMIWKTTLSKLNVRYLDVTNGCSRIVYNDASDHGYAGYEVNTIKVKIVLLTLIFKLEMKKLCTRYTLLGMFFTRQSVSGRGSSSFPVDVYLHYLQSIIRKTKETNRQVFSSPELATKCFSESWY